MKIQEDTPIEVINRVDPEKSAFLRAWCIWQDGTSKDTLPIWDLDYRYWKKILLKQCDFNSLNHQLRYSFQRDGRTITGYVFCRMQWFCAIQAMLEAEEGKLQFEIVWKNGNFHNYEAKLEPTVEDL
ncbi:hypothetical protein ABOM_004574 [Aspergillus bombycis]|uniref:Uncharacterized protein n=1 Tax=Aspergillus bombycis TaxID=109264 RepID=A0A1F8A492_9EURO|nr:hypothetical protein ABOM_004574 [Aspergillus bombycis]OGM46536.1 hypothetical protein ABOM_004574 [Aspergillus bombycis]